MRVRSNTAMSSCMSLLTITPTVGYCSSRIPTSTLMISSLRKKNLISLKSSSMSPSSPVRPSASPWPWKCPFKLSNRSLRPTPWVFVDWSRKRLELFGGKKRSYAHVWGPTTSKSRKVFHHLYPQELKIEEPAVEAPPMSSCASTKSKAPVKRTISLKNSLGSGGKRKERKQAEKLCEKIEKVDRIEKNEKLEESENIGEKDSQDPSSDAATETDKQQKKMV